MEHKNGLWIDKEGNKWDDRIYTRVRAIRASQSLIGCERCMNCVNCENCIDCSDCKFCVDCTDCYDSQYCKNCRGCSECYRCINCKDCLNCDHCVVCKDCMDCIHVHKFKSNPQRFLSAKIGSRETHTTLYWTTKKDTQIICGCWRGSLTEFEMRVKCEYRSKSKYRLQYMDFINKAKIIIE